MNKVLVASAPAGVDIAALRRRIRGDVVTPGEAGWDEARQAWNLPVDRHPALVIHAESPEDVAEAVWFARVHGLRVSPQATGTTRRCSPTPAAVP